ncbi:hypothetical protein ECG_09439 [Echinococcus granulosus]|nr:hypothetical protein ECG_09439 [Echinococcus granulosus]
MCVCDDNSRYDVDDDDSRRSRHRIGRGADRQNERDLDTDEDNDEDARKVINDTDLCDEDDDGRGRSRHRVGWRRGSRFDGCVCDGNNQYDRDDDEDRERNLYGTGKIVHRQFDRDLDDDDDVGGDDNDDGDALWDIAGKVRRVNMLRRDRGRHAYEDGGDYDDGSFHLN